MKPRPSAQLPDKVLIEALAAAIYVTDADGRITYYNSAAAEFWGQAPTLGTARWCGSWRLYRPDGSHLPHDECPLAVALKTGRPVRGVEAIAERPDGTRTRFLPYPTPLRDASGTLIGAINLLIDITDLRRAEADSQLLAAIVASSDDAIVSKTLDGHVTSWNAGAARMFGYTPDEMIGESITKIIPPELHQEEGYVLSRIRRGEHIDHYETVRVAKDGHQVNISLTVSPLRSPTGEVIGASKVARDITERKQAEAAQHMMMGELSHRVKNTLATVQAIATQSVRRSAGGDFIGAFTGRVHSLARAHDLLSETHWEGVELGALVRDQVTLGVADERIVARGPIVILEAQPALHLAMMLHELGTNARKYGALSVMDGQLSIDWQVVTATDGNLLEFQWQERGGPPVTAPTMHGFGMRLIEDSLLAHGGKASITYDADGVLCAIRLPLPGPSTHKAFAVPTFRGRSAADMAGRARLHGKRIMVLEDEPLIATEIGSILRDGGCKVVGPFSAPDEAERAILSGIGIDGALLDTNLSGKQSVDGLVAVLTRSGVPFAFVTGHGMETLPAVFRNAPVVTKPFSRDRLLSTLSTLIDKHADVGVYQLGAVRTP